MKKCKIISLVISFFLTIVIVLLSLNIIVSLFFSSKNIVRCTKKSNLSLVFNKIKNSGLVSDSSGGSIVDDLYEIALEFEVSKKDVDKIINSNISKEIVGILFGNLTDYVVNNSNDKIIDEKDIYNLVDNNIDDILKEVSINISDSQKEKFMNRLKLELPDVIKIVPTSKDLTKDKSETIDVVHFLFGNGMKLFLFIFEIILISLIIILNKRKSFSYIFVSVLCSGLIIFLISLSLEGLIMSLISSSDISIFINTYVKMLAGRLSLWGFIMCGFGMLIFLIGKILEKK